MSIEVRGISKNYRNYTALNDVSLSIPSGELVALLGPSGSGKTTLLRIIAGLDVPDSGHVFFDGTLADGLQVNERKIGFVFQHYALFRHMSVFENVAFGLRVRPKATRPDDAEIEHRVMKLLKMVHLDMFRHRFPHQLSGGQRQRVALARALAVEPQLLLLDEPFGALDAKVRKELRRWMRRLHDEIPITSIFVTHDQDEAMEIADRVVVMSQGKVEQMGTPEEVYHQPVNSFVYDFLGNYNEFHGYKDAAGDIHLSEYDVETVQPSSPISQQRSHFLGRYPALGNVVKRLPFLQSEQNATGPAHSNTVVRLRSIPESAQNVKIFARPHEMYITKTPDHEEYIVAEVVHINPAGSLVKMELERASGELLQVEVPKSVVDNLAIRKADRLYVRPKHTRVFE
jgi:sulfate transport system ATP-binding protein